MALSNQEKKTIQYHFATLDYKTGTGFLHDMKKYMTNERFVFISSGGTGHKMLERMKRELQHQVNADDVRNRVRFLAIDTAQEELEQLIHTKQNPNGIFEEHEVEKLPASGARTLIAPTTSDQNVATWVHRDLYEMTGGNGTYSREFNGTGAGAYRQVGRVYLMQATVLNSLQVKIQAMIRELSIDGPEERVNVFCFAGLAGGTGSGTVIDLGFLLRYFVREYNQSIYERTAFRAYLMLPSACGEEADEYKRARGNRNAYAAQKEIDHYMTLQERGESYEETYATKLVTIQENIFDFCTLVEGVATNGVVYEKPEQLAMKVAAESILNMMIRTGKKQENGSEIFLVDSFTCNRTSAMQDKIRSHNERVWPRNANYVYDIIGFSQSVIPLDLLYAYVGKKIFDLLYQKYKKVKRISEDVVDQFLENCGLDEKSLYKNTSKSMLEKGIRIELDQQMKVSGPYYMIELLKEAIERLQNTKGMYRKKAEENAKGWFKRSSWEEVVKKYDTMISEVFIPMKENEYAIYAEVFDELNQVLERNVKLLTDTKQYETVFGMSDCWSPINFTPGSHTSDAVRQYLDELFSEKEIQEKAKKFRNRLIEHRNQWTAIEKMQGEDKFEPEKEIREFMQEEVAKVAGQTVESILVKVYSNDKEATITEFDVDGREVPSRALQNAGRDLIQQFDSQARALADIKESYLNDCYKQRYLTIPMNCPWLKEVLEKLVHAKWGNDVTVYESDMTDRIVFYTLYDGVPAYMLQWTKRAEEDYEKDCHAVGLHMCQALGGRDWTRFPNLYVEDLWEGIDYQIRGREASILEQVNETMEWAKNVGFVEEHQENYKKYYSIYLPTFETIRLGKELLLEEGRLYETEEIKQILIQTQHLEEVMISYALMVTETEEMPRPESFDWKMAKQIVRRKVELMDRIYAGMEQMKQVLEEVAQHNHKAKKGDKIKKYMSLFIELVAMEWLVYDEIEEGWIIKIPKKDEKTLCRVRTRLERECKEYYAIKAFSELEETLLCEWERDIEQMMEEMTREQKLKKKEKKEQWKQEVEAVRSGESPQLLYFPMTSERFVKEAGKELAEEIRHFYDQLLIQL